MAIRGRAVRRGTIAAGLSAALLLTFASAGNVDAATKTTKKKATPTTKKATATTAAPGTAAPATTAAAPTTAKPADDLAGAQKLVDSMLNFDLTFPRPTEPFSRGVHTVSVVASGMSSPGPAAVANAISEALETTMGWKFPSIYDGKFSPIEQAALISKSVADKAEAIFLVSITPSTVAAAVAEAQRAKIPMFCILCGPDLPAGMYGIQADAIAAGNAQAAYATAKSGGKGQIVVYHNTEFAFSEQQMKQASKRLGEICPGCKVENRSLLLAEARIPNAPLFTSLLSQYPSGRLDFVLLPFDSPAASLSNTASQLGRSDFGIVGYGALAPFVDMVGLGEPSVAKASVTISTPYYGWAAVDLAGRVLAGRPVWKADAMPVAMITKENFKKYPPGFPFVGPPFDYKTYFTALWKK